MTNETTTPVRVIKKRKSEQPAAVAALNTALAVVPVTKQEAAAAQVPAVAAVVPPTAKVEPVEKVSPPASAVTRPSELLINILCRKRCHGTAGDSDFRIWLHAYIRQMGLTPDILAEGVIRVVVDPKSTTMFSCHVDTMHGQVESSVAGARQALTFDPDFQHIFLTDKSTSMCLGADDGAGIYIMLTMMKHKVSGTYMFHTGEERGGIGSRAVLDKSRLMLENYDRCIAFDRAGYEDVIITQGGQPCASPEAGNWLAAALNTGTDFKYKNSTKGSFTDSKTYAVVIPECFNLSVGYFDQHHSSEYQDVEHLEKLIKACLGIKWGSMPTVRKVPVARPVFHNGVDDIRGMSHGGRDFRQQELLEEMYPRPQQSAKKEAVKPVLVPVAPTPLIEECMGYCYTEFEELAELDAGEAAKLLMRLVAKVKGLEAQVSYWEDQFS